MKAKSLQQSFFCRITKLELLLMVNVGSQNLKHILNIQTDFLMKLLPGHCDFKIKIYFIYPRREITRNSYLGYTLTMLKERKDHTGAPDVGLWWNK